MPTFNKEILKPGTYTVLGLDGSRRVEEITPQRIRKWVAAFNAMKSRGIHIPAPWGHKLDIKAGTKTDAPLSDPRNNAGFWNELAFDETTGRLTGVLEVPEIADAEKVGTTIKEVSPLVQAGWVDGLGNKYDEAILHIALCTNPVIPGQENFEPVSDATLQGAMACSLSGWMGDLGAGAMPAQQGGALYDNAIAGDPTLAAGMTGTIFEAIRSLRALGLDLPPDTHEGNFLERITVAARAYLSAKRQSMLPGGMDSIQQEPTPVVMSNTTQNSQESAAYIAYASNMARQDYERRIAALARSGRLTDAYRQKHIDPLLRSFQLSLDTDGKPKPTQLDMLLEALEALPVPKLFGASAVTTKGFTASHSPGYEGDPPDLNVTDSDYNLDPEELDKIVDAQFKASGYFDQLMNSGNNTN